MKEFFESDNHTFIQWINRQWGIEYGSVYSDVDIQGSPERSIDRTVFNDRQGKRFLIEKFNLNKQLLREKVASTVDYLNTNGLTQALPYYPNPDGIFLPVYDDYCYQVSDYLDSTGLKQPDYLSSAVMGESFGRFLSSMADASDQIESQILFEPFSIKTYIYELFDQMELYDPKVYKDYIPILIFLEKEFMSVHDQLPVSFCHGDLHPLNVIWNGDLISSVIDWEFTGIKPDIYDLANLVGCAGIEDPNGMGMPMVMTCINYVKQQNLYSELGLCFFPEYILALRFAWLSEWLRKKDQEMIDMELAYMNILMNNIDVIRVGWNLPEK